jgi:two-component system phosphate regulon sensor histidine kinase PhoR
MQEPAGPNGGRRPDDVLLSSVPASSEAAPTLATVNTASRFPSLTRRLLTRYALTLLAVLAVLGLALDRVLENALLDDLTRSLEAQGRAVQATLPDRTTLQPHVVALGRDMDLRITVIRTDGVVLADSSRDPSTIENHADRPEVRAAVRGRVGVASRTSETVGAPFRYVALPARAGIVVRVALPLAIVHDRLNRVRLIVVLGAMGAALLGLAAVYAVARGLTRPLRRMSESVAAMSGGDLDVRVPGGGAAELDLLADTLNRMSDWLRASIQEARDAGQVRDVVLSAMEEGVVLVEADDSVRYANPAAAELLGVDPSDVRSLPASVRRLVEEVRTAGGVKVDELEAGYPTRLLRGSAVRVAGGRRVLVVVRDVTEARRVEAMRRDFVANTSHELKTPVAAIQAAAETLRDAVRQDPGAAPRFAEQLHGDALRLSRIVADLLDLSRLESESPVRRPVRLDRLAAQEADRLREQAELSGVTIEVNAEPVSVQGSAEDLALLVRNLLDNAVRYSPDGGRVRVGVDSHDGEAFLSVRDTGIGIPSRDLPRIFERFYRVDRARSRQSGGTGLGLAIAKHVAELHGGRIEVESELGQGSEFLVHLPTKGGAR